ncbi:MAG TPA: FtsX-like permease family protein [Terracidiphilus sp.]|nr:FtsX-like permease family protein [Terracidiphilus sp.]
MNKLVIANLLHRPLRSLISIFAVAIEVVMILSIVAIFMGQLSSAKERNNGIGADLIVMPPNASFMNGISGAPMSVKLVPFLQKLPHVVVASPAITNLSMGNSLEVLWGIDYESYAALKPFNFLSGGPFQHPYDVIVDDVFAQSDGGHRVGQTISILNHEFRICGIVENGKGGRKLIPIDTMAQLIGSEGKATDIYLKVDQPENEQTVIEEIHNTKGLENYKVQTMADLIALYTPSKFPGFSIAMNVVITIAVIVGFLVIFQSMYTAVLERTREIGILKSLGSSKLTIVSVVLRETSVLAIAGVLLGIAGTFGVRELLHVKFTTLAFDLTKGWIGYGALIAFVGALFGALYPAWMASRKDPIEALAYE